MKYKEWLMNWLTNYVMPNYKSRTYDRYSDIVAQHIIPKLGDYDLSELTPFIVQQFITDLTTHGNLKNGNGLAANTVNSIITVIQQSMETAHNLKGLHILILYSPNSALLRTLYNENSLHIAVYLI